MSVQFPLLLLPQLVWDNMENYLRDNDLWNLYIVLPELKYLVKRIDDIITKKVMYLLVSKSYLEINDLVNCYGVSDKLTGSVLASWCHQISQRDFTWNSSDFIKCQKLDNVETIQKFLEKVEKLDDIENFLFFIDNEFQFSFELPSGFYNPSYVENYRKCMNTLFNKFGQFCLRVRFSEFKSIKIMGSLMTELLWKLKNMQTITFFMQRDRSSDTDWTTSRKQPVAQNELNRELDKWSLESFYSLKSSNGFPLDIFLPSVPISIAEKIKILEIDSTVDGVATAAPYLPNLKELKLKIVRDGWKKLYEGIEEHTDFFGKIRKLTLIFLGPCLLINNLCRLSNCFENTTELHLEIHDRNNQLVNADESRWPVGIFKNVRKFSLRLGDNFFYSPELRRMDHPPPLTFLKLFPAMKIFHFISDLHNGVELISLIKDLKLKELLKDELGFYETLENGLVANSKLWHLLPHLETLQVTIGPTPLKLKTFTEYHRISKVNI